MANQMSASRTCAKQHSSQLQFLATGIPKHTVSSSGGRGQPKRFIRSVSASPCSAPWDQRQDENPGASIFLLSLSDMHSGQAKHLFLLLAEIFKFHSDKEDTIQQVSGMISLMTGTNCNGNYFPSDAFSFAGSQ